MTNCRAYVLFALWGLIAVLLAMVPMSCSVKESREECPTYLSLSIRTDELPEGNVGILGWDNGVLFRDNIASSELSSYFIRTVSKGSFYVSAYAGGKAALSDSHYVWVPSGCQADSLYGFYTRVNTTEEDAHTDVDFHKQFCTVHLSIGRSAEQMKDFRFRVTGNTSGFDMLNFKALPGAYSYVPEHIPGEDEVTFRILRQVDSSMSLEVFRCMPDGETRSDIGDGFLSAGEFPLGKYIERTGYDWEAVELDDVYVTIGFALEYVTVGVGDWEEGTTFGFIEQ